jgi:hypothetical protein
MWKSAGRAPSKNASYTLAFALQLRKKHGKTSVRLRKTSVITKSTHRLRKTSVITESTHTYTYTHAHVHTLAHTHTHTSTHTHPHFTKQYKTTTVQIETNTVHGIPK